MKLCASLRPNPPTPNPPTPTLADGRTPLHLACLKGHAEVATFLIQKGGWVGSEDARDNTPLHLAARWVLRLQSRVRCGKVVGGGAVLRLDRAKRAVPAATAP